MNYRLLSVCLATAAGLIAPHAPAEFGKIDAVPAATLLLPFFEVDLDSTPSFTTLFSVNNADDQEAIAHVTLWSNLGVATFAFDIVLNGFDVQTVNLRDIFDGRLPSSGGITEILSEPVRLALVAAHTGQPNEDSGLCSGFNFGDNVARGYITIDVMNETGAGFPFEDGYFVDGGTGKASNRNVLWGDYMHVDPSNNFAQGEKMVHIEAEPINFKGGIVVDTFYRHFVSFDGRDNREPLATLWSAGYDQRSEKLAGTQLIVWREIDTVMEPFNCASGTPQDFPLRTVQVVAFDELENSFGVEDSALFPLVTNSTDVSLMNLPFEKGWLFLNLNLALGKGTVVSAERQSYVLIRNHSQGRFSTGLAATPFDSFGN